jgi:hypothetical protein
MQRNRQRCRNFRNYLPFILLASLWMTSCAVYTVDFSHLQPRIVPGDTLSTRGLNRILHTSVVQYNNHLDSVPCLLADGYAKMKKIRSDARLRIITKNRQVISFYARTVYIWKNEFLIGECSSISWKSTLYRPVRLKDIVRVEVVS